jgi:transcriptional regulator with XRE-family HTH domain
MTLVYGDGMESSNVTPSFGQKLVQLLEDKQMRQSTLADRIKVSRNTVSAWCNDTKTPGIDRRRDIARVLDIPVYQLLDTSMRDAEELSEDLIAAAREGYRHDAAWHMRVMPPDGGRQGGNAAAFAFSPSPSILVREVGQNSSDEKLPTEPTVRLVLTVYELTGEPLERFLQASRFSDLREHLEAAAPENHKVGNVIRAGLERLDSNQSAPLVLMRIDDYNATGLTGPERGKASKFAAVMRNVLDSEKDETKGGSYGLGSNVMWACSRFGLVFSNSFLSEALDGRRRNRVLGCVQLPSHTTRDGKQWAGPGWFGKDTEIDGVPVADSYWDNPALVRDLQLERESDLDGTSFLIVQAYDPSNSAETLDEWHDRLVDAAAGNFWAAMTDESDDVPARLQVVVRTKRLGGKDAVSRETIVDPSEIVADRVAMLRAYYDGQTVDELDKPGDVIYRPIRLDIPARTVRDDEHERTSHEAILLVAQSAERDKTTNRLQAMRGSLMKIVDQEVRALPLGARPFHAALLAGEAASPDDPDARLAERMLRAAEPPDHNDWRSTSDLTDSYAKGAVQAIENFIDAAKKEIRAAVDRPSSDDSDGPDSLRSLLRMVEPQDPVRRPTIRRVTGSLNGEGAWEVEVTVSVPADTRWHLSPVVKFATESGGGIPVSWSELTAVDKCRVDATNTAVIPDPGQRVVKFRGTTDPKTHPVSAQYARAEVELRPMKGSAA